MDQSPTPPRALFYSHDTVGLGHLRRSLLICSGLKERFSNLDTLLITGSAMAHAFRIPPGIDYIKLPCVTKLDNERYESRSLGLPFDLTLRLREDIIFQVTIAYQPDIFFVDNVPLGMKGEIRKTLEFLRSSKPDTTVVLGLRDILDDSCHIVPLWRDQAIFEAIERLYDRIYIYGSPAVFDPPEEYGWGEGLRKKTRFCGYLRRTVDPNASRAVRGELLRRGQKLILVTVGGGSDGAPVIESYLRALPEIQACTPAVSVILLGPELGTKDAKRFMSSSTGDQRIKFLDFSDDALRYMAAADVVVSMGGYNTVSEILSLKKKAVVIPRIHPRREQVIRAERLQKLGLLKMIHPDRLNPSLLASEVVSLLATKRSCRATKLDFRGIDSVAADVQTFIAQKRPAHPACERSVSGWTRRTAI